jgi:hypothetical protein
MSGFSGWQGDQGTGSAGVYGKSGYTLKLTLTFNYSYTRTTQSYATTLVQDWSITKVSQNVATALNRTSEGVRASLMCITALIPSKPRVLFPQYPAPPGTTQFDPPETPQLIGLAYTVFKRPVRNSGTFQALSGREIRVDYYAATVWQWDLTYSYLPDRVGPRHPSTTDSDLATMISFFLETRGGQMPFTFYDPDDHFVTHTHIGVGDGVQNWWVITREYGLLMKETEPIGYVVAIFPQYYPYCVMPLDNPKVYLDNVLQDPSLYDYNRTELGKQLIRFHTPPASGAVITMTFYHLFFTRFADLNYEFEKFLNQIWSAQKITLESMRSYR